MKHLLAVLFTCGVSPRAWAELTFVYHVLVWPIARLLCKVKISL